MDLPLPVAVEVCVCVCVCVCMRACMHACVRACMRACYTLTLAPYMHRTVKTFYHDIYYLLAKFSYQ